jgi:hypothetical protein
VTSWGLLSIDPDYRLELRALDTGEVLAIWPDKTRNTAVSPSGRLAAFATADGSLWILRPTDGREMTTVNTRRAALEREQRQRKTVARISPRLRMTLQGVMDDASVRISIS